LKIENNPYCNAENIVDGVKDKMSRSVVFKKLKELSNDNRITDVSDNRRENKYILDKNNEFNIIKKNIDDLKKNYYTLLESSLFHTQIQNVINKVNLKTSEIDNKIIIAMSFSKALNDFQKAQQLNEKRKHLIDKMADPLGGKKINNLKGSFSSEIYATIKVSKSKSKQIAKRNLFLLKKSNILLNKYEIHLRKSAYASLRYLPINLFMMLTNYILLKSAISLPKIIKDKEVLLKLNRFIYEEILEINSELAKYILKSEKNLEISNLEDYTSIEFSRNIVSYMVEVYQSYSILGLEKEIRNVLNSFNVIRGKNIEFDIEKKHVGSIIENSNLILSLNQGLD
jgi:hypothetical protein